MKTAISTDNGNVSAHFGRCPEFTILEIDNGQIINKTIIENPGHHPGHLPPFLSEKGVECIIAGGMGNRAQMLFDQYKIRTILGISGKISDIEKMILNGTLKGGESLCKPGDGKGYGIDKTVCDHD